MDLQDSFKEFCEQKKLEINPSQTEIINLLDIFLIRKKTFLSRFFKREKSSVFIYMEK